MTRLYMAGAEIFIPGTAGANASPDFATSITAPATLTRDTTTFRSGVASYGFNSGSPGNVAVSTTTPTIVDGRTYFARAYVRVPANPSATIDIFRIVSTSSTIGVKCQITSTGTLVLRVNNVVQGSASASITDSAWHRVELKAVTAATSLTTAAELQLDGVSVATFSGSVTTGTGTQWGIVGNASAVANWVINVDDVALNDDQGSVNNSYPGAGNVVLLLPTSDNARTTGWVTGAGGTTSLFDAVNGTPPEGVADTGTATSQIRNASAEASASYDANMTTYTAAGVGASDTINAVQNVVATAAPVTTSAKQGLVGNASNPAITTIALDATGTSGAFWSGVTAGTFGTGWKWSKGTMTEQPSVTLGASPVMRITQVTSSTRIADVCFMGIYVDYTPGVAAATTSRATVTMAPYIPSRGGF